MVYKYFHDVNSLSNYSCDVYSDMGSKSERLVSSLIEVVNSHGCGLSSSFLEKSWLI